MYTCKPRKSRAFAIPCLVSHFRCTGDKTPFRQMTTEIRLRVSFSREIRPLPPIVFGGRRGAVVPIRHLGLADAQTGVSRGSKPMNFLSASTPLKLGFLTVLEE